MTGPRRNKSLPSDFVCILKYPEISVAWTLRVSIFGSYLAANPFGRVFLADFYYDLILYILSAKSFGRENCIYFHIFTGEFPFRCF